MIHWDLCKKFKFDHTARWYMQKVESTSENETHNILWDSEIQLDHLILARRPDPVKVNKTKRDLSTSGRCRPSRPLSEIKKKKRKEKQVFRPCQAPEKTMEHDDDSVTSCNWCAWNDPKELVMRLDEIGRAKTIQITALLRSARSERMWKEG